MKHPHSGLTDCLALSLRLAALAVADLSDAIILSLLV